MSTTDVADFDGVRRTIQSPLPPSRAAAVSSRPVVLSNEDLAAINALGTLLTTIAGYVDGLEGLITATNTKIDSLITQGNSTAAVLVASADEYETVAPSQTDQVLGSTGATGDRLGGLIINPATTSPGNVILKDGSTTIYTFAGGTLSDIGSIIVPLGIKSVSGAFKVTTGANVSVFCPGDFT